MTVPPSVRVCPHLNPALGINTRLCFARGESPPRRLERAPPATARLSVNTDMQIGFADQSDRKYGHASTLEADKNFGDGIGEPPAHLDATEKQIWAELIQNAPDGVLTSADRVILALACQLEAKARTRTISDAQRNQLIKCLSLFGFTPADRSRITAVETKDEIDPFAKFIN